jgi:hypothetical protein
VKVQRCAQRKFPTVGLLAPAMMHAWNALQCCSSRDGQEAVKDRSRAHVCNCLKLA